MFYFYYFPPSGYAFPQANHQYNLYIPTFQTGTPPTPQNHHQNSVRNEPQPPTEEPPRLPDHRPSTMPAKPLPPTEPIQKQKTKNKLGSLPFADKHNIIPNNINHILAFAQRKSKSQKIVLRILEKLRTDSPRLSSKAFYSYQSYVKNKLSVHVNIKSLETVLLHLDPDCSIFSLEEQLAYNRVCRIAIRYYLRELAALVTLHSQRLKNTNKEDHIKVQRYLMSVVQNLEEISASVNNSKAQKP